MNELSAFKNSKVSNSIAIALTLANHACNSANQNLQERVQAIAHYTSSSTVCKTQTDVP